MIQGDFHVHTCYCDGKDTPAELAEAALKKGFSALGFSGHSHTPRDPSYCIPAENIARYKAEIAALKEQYRGKLTILCGLEQDWFSDDPAADYDYTIGSVHYLETPDGLLSLDHTFEILKDGIDRYFEGDPLLLAERYFEMVAKLPGHTRVDIIGHFDLITKFQEQEPLFDTSHPRYMEAALGAIRSLIPLGLPFEVNTGAMARGMRSDPYPAAPLLRAISEQGGQVIVNSDCHDKRKLGFGFEQATHLLRAVGFSSVLTLTDAGFQKENI